MSKFDRVLCTCLLLLCGGFAVQKAFPEAQIIQQVQAETFKPISGANYTSIAAPGANTDAITDVVWRADWGSTLHVVVQCETSTVVNVMIEDSTGNIDNGLNSNTALVAGARYEFQLGGMKAGEIVNLQSETDTVWDKAIIGFVEDK